MTKKALLKIIEELHSCYYEACEKKLSADEFGDIGFSICNCLSNAVYQLELVSDEMDRLKITKI